MKIKYDLVKTETSREESFLHLMTVLSIMFIEYGEKPTQKKWKEILGYTKSYMRELIKQNLTQPFKPTTQSIKDLEDGGRE